jgi:DNA-binding MarR family transcriptional regulator
MSSVSSVVDDVRGFNRFYTRVLGLLRPHLVGSSFGLTEARVLFELAHRGDVEASDLGSELDLDAGYLSRILSGFTASGLVTRERSATDGRRQVVRLTGDGRQAFAEIDQLQARAIDNILAALDEAQRKELVTSMGRIRRILGDEPRRAGLLLRPPIRLPANHVVDQRRTRGRSANLRARRLRARPPRATPQLRARPRRRVLVP